MHREEAKTQFTLTKHHIVNSKQGNSGTHVDLGPTCRITNYLRKRKENYGRKSYVILTNMFLDCFLCEQARVRRKLYAFQTRACSLFAVIAPEFFPSE